MGGSSKGSPRRRFRVTLVGNATRECPLFHDPKSFSGLFPATTLLVLTLASILPAAEPAPQDLLRAAKKNMQGRTWKVDVLVQGDHACRIKGLIHERDFDLTVKTEFGDTRQIAVGKESWESKDDGKTWEKTPTADRRYYFLTHAPMNYKDGDKFPPFEKLETSTTEDGTMVMHVRFIDPKGSPVQYLGDRPNAWIAIKDGKADVLARNLGPLVFEKDYITGDVHYTPADGEKILPPPGNPKAVPNANAPEELLTAAMKKMEQGIWEVSAELEVAKKARLQGLLEGRNFDLIMEQRDGNLLPLHPIGLRGAVWSSLDEGKSWKIQASYGVAPYNWVHSPILYKAITPPFVEISREPHDGETWVQLQLKVDEKLDDKSDLPTYWVALDKDGRADRVSRVTKA